MNRRLLLVFFAAASLWAAAGGESNGNAEPSPVIRPQDDASTLVRKPPLESVNWNGLFKQSAFFLGIQHGFRLATEPGTRDGFRGSYFRGWGRSVGNLHGWSDGDPFYVNYVGHPMAGAVAGYIWTQNDRAYSREQFGKDRRYWKSRLRAMAFSFAYSTQFEIGPFSEASIGHIQSLYPQQGFVDHVVTPTLGVGGWMLAEDVVDRYLIRRFEQSVRNPYARLFVRSGLNPSRTVANVLRGEAPWARDSRGGVLMDNPLAGEKRRTTEVRNEEPLREVAPFEFTTSARLAEFAGVKGGSLCAGAGGTGAFRLSPTWQAIVDVEGCKLVPLEGERGGDALFYSVGPRWTAANLRWRPHFQFTVGGQKIVRDNGAIKDTGEDNNAFAFGAGGGLDFRVNRALAIRVANFELRHAWMRRPDFEDYRTSVSFTSGVVLQMGTW